MKSPLCLAALFLLVAASAHAVEFGPDSATISNPYFPAKIGDWGFSQGVSDKVPNGTLFYIQAVGTETVSGAQIDGKVFDNVKCLKVHLIETDDSGDNEHEFLAFSLAQDTEGNVWVIKVYSYMENKTALLGGFYFQSMLMPAVPAVGLPAGIKMPENEYNKCRIMETGIASWTTSFGTYTDCIKTHCYDEDPSDIEVDYYCRGIGIVSNSSVDRPKDFVDLRDYGTVEMKRGAVVIPMVE